MDKVGQDNLRHAMANDCTDSDCEIHHPDVGIDEGTVTLTNLAFYVAGALTASDQIRNELDNGIEELMKENFVHYHEEAFVIDSHKGYKPQSLDAAQHFEQEDR